MGQRPGPVITKGHHNNPEVTRKGTTSYSSSIGKRCPPPSVSSWSETGGLYGYELVKYKGTQVAPAKLEGFLIAHPAAMDMAVMGPSRNGHELPRAYVVLAPPARGEVFGRDMMDHVGKQVDSCKQLREGVVFADAVPRIPSGEIPGRQLGNLRCIKSAGQVARAGWLLGADLILLIVLARVRRPAALRKTTLLLLVPDWPGNDSIEQRRRTAH